MNTNKLFSLCLAITTITTSCSEQRPSPTEPKQEIAKLPEDAKPVPENTWNINHDCTVISVKLSRIHPKKKDLHYITFFITISNKGNLKSIKETSILLMDMENSCNYPYMMAVSPGDLSDLGIKKFHFDQHLGILEIDFNGYEKHPPYNDKGSIQTASKLIITRSPRFEKNSYSTQYACDATLEYQTRFTLDDRPLLYKPCPEWRSWKEQPEWIQHKMQEWEYHQYTSVDEIILPGGKLM